MSTASVNVVNANDTDLNQLYSELAHFDPPAAAGSATNFILIDGTDGVQFSFSGTGFSYNAATHEVKTGTITGFHLQTGGGTDIATYSFSAGFSALGLMNAVHTLQSSVDKSGLDAIFGAYSFNFTGNTGADAFTGYGNADTMSGGAGNDVLDGSGGIDTLTYASAGAGVTVNLSVAAQQDTVGAGKDTLSNFENLTGSTFNDGLTGNTAANIINGDTGDDHINGGAGNDTLDGGAGNDTVSYQYLGNGAQLTVVLGTFNAATGTDAQTTTSGVVSDADKISNFENIVGGGGNDTLTGNAAANNIAGGGGDDLVQGGAGGDTLDGGSGNDTVSYAASGAGVDVALAGSATVLEIGGDAAGDLVSNFENAIGSAHDDTLQADIGNNVLNGGAGNDTIGGGAGDDTIIGGTGADILDGGTGSEINGDTLNYAASTAGVTITVNSAGAGLASGGDANGDTISHFENVIGSAFNDVLSGDSGNNTLTGSAGNDLIDPGSGGNDSIDGGLGNDTVTFASATELVHEVTVNSNNDTGGFVIGARSVDVRNIENLIGSAFNDALSDGGGVHSVKGEAGDDFIIGASDMAADILDGGVGSDTIAYDSSADTGGVTLTLGANGAQTVGHGGAAEGDAISNFENIIGTIDNDVLTGNAGQNSIMGDDGDDVIVGGAGADTLNGQAGNNTVSYATSASGVTVAINQFAIVTEHGGDAEGDTLQGFENIIGSAKDDVLTGDGTSGTIDGGAGNDTIDGGAGDDVLKGNTGTADTLSYASAAAGVTVSLAITTQQTTVGDGNDTLTGFENLMGSSHDDSLTGDAHDNVMDGGVDGNDALDGGGGTDTLTFATATQGINVDGNTGFALGTRSVSILNFEKIIGSNFDDFLDAGVLIGNTVNYFDGGAGNDQISSAVGAKAHTALGGTGDDFITGSAGSDTLDGGNAGETTGDTVDYQYLSSTTKLTVTLGALNAATGAVAQTTTSGVSGDADKISNFENIRGGGGNDVLTGNAGDNNIIGGLGDDRISGGAGADVLDGSFGTDTLLYTSSTAGVTVTLNSSNAAAGHGGDAEGDSVKNFENVTGSAHNDVLQALDANNNILDGGAGDDVILGGLGDDVLKGGAGIDTVSYTTAQTGVTVSLSITTPQNTGGAGTDTISGFENLAGSNLADQLTGDANANVINGLSGADVIVGGGGNDTLRGGDASDKISGGTGNDSIEGGGGGDLLDGGIGIDTLSYDGSLAGVTANLTQQGTNLANGDADFTHPGTAQTGGDAANDLIWNFENIIGSSLDDTLTGDNKANILKGGDGNDVLAPGGGADTIDGGAGLNDTLTYATSGLGVTVSLGKDGVQTTGAGGDAAGDKISNIEDVGGSPLNDILTGNNLVNKLQGHAGDDTIQGGAGADQLDGGVNNSVGDTLTYAASAAAVTVTLTQQGTSLGNGDADFAHPGLAQHGGDAEGDLLWNFENIVGSAHDDVLTGDANANTITGGAGNDVLSGGAGNDVIDGGAGNDTIEGGTGGIGLTTDKLIGGAGIDTISYEHSANGVQVDLNVQNGTTAQQGSSGDSSFDVLSGFENVFGSSSNDVLVGNSGSNIIRGGAGVDHLTGGAGADHFQYQAASDGGNGELITDFATGDKISILKSGFGGNLTGLPGSTLDSHYFVAAAGASATESGHGQFLFDTSQHVLYWDDDGTGADAKTVITLFQGSVTLHASDFDLR